MSEFLETVIKADAGHVWRVLDEFMDALKETKPDVCEFSERMKKWG